MAQRILGIDLGAHAIKAAQLEVGFNSIKLISMETLTVPLAIGKSLEHSLAQLTGLSMPDFGVDAVNVGIPGDRALLRLLDIPFVEPKKIGAIVGNELADDLPWEMEDVIFDHLPLPVPISKVLAGAVRSIDVKAVLEAFSKVNIDPRVLAIAPLSYAGLLRRIDPTGTLVMVDIGHLRTNVCLIQGGKALAARTLSRGGHQLTDAFRQYYQLSYIDAQALKEKVALLPLPQMKNLSPEEQQFASVTTQAMAPLIRDLRLTLGLFAIKLGIKPERIVLGGGTSLIRGIEEYFTMEFGMPTERLSISNSESLQQVALTPEGQVIGALSLGLALEQGGRQSLNMRQGEFAYRTDASFIKDKALAIAVSVVLVLIFAAVNAYSSLYALRKEEQSLTRQLQRATKMIFGEVMENPRNVSRQVKAGAKATSSGIPQKTAFDILNFLSTGIPKVDKVKIDITRLDIKQGKTYLTGTADTRSAVGDIVKSLEKNPCLSKVATGTISDVSEGKKQFSLTITTECF